MFEDDRDSDECRGLMIDWTAGRVEREGAVILHAFKFRGEGIQPDWNLVVVDGETPDRDAHPVRYVSADDSGSHRWSALRSAASCYYPLNPSRVPASLKTSKHHVIEVRRLGVDLDVKDHPDTPKKLDELRDSDELAAKLWQHQLDGRVAIARVIETYAGRYGSPTTCVDSGGGFQLGFDLDEPVKMPPGHLNDAGEMLRGDGTVTTDTKECALNPEREKVIADVEARNLGLIERFDAIVADLGVGHLVEVDHTQDICRIFRTPWAVNRPDDRKRKKGRRPTWARLVFEDREVTHALDSFPLAAKATKTKRGSTTAVDIDLGSVPRITGELSDVLPAGVTERCKAVIMQGMDPDQPLSDGNSRSEWVWYVCCELVRNDVDDGTIYAILTDKTFPISEHVYAQGANAKQVHRYVVRQIQRAKEQDQGDTRAPIERAFAANLEKLGVVLEYDEFADQVKVSGLEGFGPLFNDAGMRRLRFLFSTITEENKVPQKELFHELCLNHAQYHVRHPVREYLDGVQDRWDGVPRVETWLIDHFGAEDAPYVRAVSRIFLVAAVRRVRRPGCKFDEMLVLEGEQGHGKSTGLKRLAVNEDWFSDDLPLNADGKRVIEQTGGKWIIECGELKGMKQGDIETLKGTLSRTHDRARLAYGRLVSDVPRQWISAGTTNNRKYLKDQTGNRRFWPVETGRIDLDGFTRDVVDQLWAEAATLEAAGQSIRLAPALYDAAAEVQSARTTDDPISEKLESVLDGLDDACVTSDDLWTILGARDTTKRAQSMNDKLGETMRRLGFERKQRRIGGRRQWCYQRGSKEPPHVPPHVPARVSEKGMFLGWVGVDAVPDPEDTNEF